MNSRKDMDKWFRKIVIPQSMRTKPINRKVSDYQETSDEYSTCVYEGGKLFLYELWKAMGDKTFFEMLQKRKPSNKLGFEYMECGFMHIRGEQNQ